MSKFLPLIVGLNGIELSENEKKFILEYKPWGIILFERNCRTYLELLKLIENLKKYTHENLPILIDQEGGRVSRLNFPEFPKTLPAKTFGSLYLKDKQSAIKALTLNTKLIAYSLKQIGINVNTAPVLDLPIKNESGVIGDRAYGSDKNLVSEMAKNVLNVNSAYGIASVIKHIPGHGKATLDSHFDLPKILDEANILENEDFIPFIELNSAPLAMTAHAIYTAYDKINAATLSSKIINEIIREKIGFEGVLMSDDISMKAMSPDVANNSLAALNAGCDLVLHCNGDIDEMTLIANRILDLDLIEVSETLLNIFKNEKSLDVTETQRELTHILNGTN
jgi:beta-N-acetylhexosaminidase|tara:strand:+ start:174 stop:1184 length:1011 start_codon:yes stop_codon:yes gene_type:complete